MGNGELGAARLIVIMPLALQDFNGISFKLIHKSMDLINSTTPAIPIL